MKQVYVQNNIGEEMDYDYDLKYEDGKTVCLYSHNSEWTEHLQGQKAGSIKDIDDGFLIKIGDKKIELDYCDMQVLKILLLSDLEGTDYFEIRESITINCEVYCRKFEITKSMLIKAVLIGIMYGFITGLLLEFLLKQNK